MKRPILIGLAILGVVAIFVGAICLQIRSQRPEALIRKLRHARAADQELLVMKLGIAGGDVIEPMIQALHDTSAPMPFRLMMLDLLFKKHRRAADERIAVVIRESVHSPEAEIRRAAARGIVTFGTENEHVLLADSIADRDPEVRRVAYGVFLDYRSFVGAWAKLDDAQREKLVKIAGASAAAETDPELRQLARSIVGHQIVDFCQKARESVQKSDAVTAEKLLRDALALDPSSRLAWVSLARTFLAIGDKDKAIKLAGDYGALVRIPLLPAAPAIDGDPTDAVWGQALTSDLKYQNVYPWLALPCQGKSRLYLGHRNGKLYVAVIGYEDDVRKLVVKHKNRDESVWEDDCAELFFDPGAAGNELYQFVINAGGGLFDSYQGQGSADFKCEYASQIFPDRGYWACEFAVAAADLHGQSLTADSVWGVNIVRTRIGGGSECCSYWPLFGNNREYQRMPLAIFQGAPAGK